MSPMMSLTTNSPGVWRRLPRDPRDTIEQENPRLQAEKAKKTQNPKKNQGQQENKKTLANNKKKAIEKERRVNPPR